MIDRVKSVIHLNNLWHNYQLLQNIHHLKEVMAVVKSDAYGHGAKEVAAFLEEKGCRYFAVTDLIEAIELREAGIESMILILGKTSPKHAHLLYQYRLTQTVDSYEYAEALNHQALPIDIHLVLDTGMSRFGLYCHREENLLKTIEEIHLILRLPYLNQCGIYTHFAIADGENDAFTKQQFDMFKRVVDQLEGEGIDLGKKHCSNSASILKFPEHAMNMVRAGIAMYGYPPIQSKLLFKPVMSVFAKVIAMRNLVPGDVVSYGLTYHVTKPMRVASIAIGYGDGYDRLFSNNDYFLYHKQKLEVVGRVCMGVTMVDASDCAVTIGEFVEVFGEEKPLAPMAEAIGTITYELLTNMAKKRVKFIYDK